MPSPENNMTIERPRSLVRETPVGRGTPLLVAAPRSSHGRAAAGRIERALRQLGGQAELAADPVGDVLGRADGPVIVVGNLADSRCVRQLYFQFMCATDLWYPGPGGYELRTLCNPFGTGHNVILLGYSDAVGAQAGTDELLSRLDDPIPHLAVLQVTRLPLAEEDAERLRCEPLPQAAWEIANIILGDSKGYLYYLTGDPELGEEYRRAWRAIIESGYKKTEQIVQAHLYSLNRLQSWLLVEHMDLFDAAEQLEITRFIYGWAQSDEGLHHVMQGPRVQGPHNPRQNHELIPALALAYAADYFGTHFPGLPGPEQWLEAAVRAFGPYGASWKPLCDGLCHGWFLSQPIMLEYALRDPQHRYFEQGGARRAAECAMAVVNNAGWMPTAGDGDLTRQFPGPSLRVAAAYFDDGRYRFAHDLAPPERRLAWLLMPPRAFDAGVEARVPEDMVGVTVVPVDPLVYHVWERDAGQAPGVVTTPPAAPIEQCFDKLAVRTGWKLEDDYLLIDGLGGGSHSYDDAAGVLDYARLGLSLIVQEDSIVHSAPEHHSVVTIVRNGESGEIPGFAILEAKSTDSDGKVYLRIRLSDYAGADWVREVHLHPGSCVIFNDTVIAREAGNFAIETRFRTPARLVLNGREAQCKRQSPCVGEVVFRIESSCAAAQLAVVEDPIYLRYKKELERQLWMQRYHTDDVVLTSLVARQAVHLEAGQGVRLTHLAQVCGPGETPVRLLEMVDGVSISTGATAQRLETVAVRRPAAQKAAAATGKTKLVRVLDAGSSIGALWRLDDGSLVAGTEDGQVFFLDAEGRVVRSVDLAGPVYDIGAAPGAQTILGVGHGASSLTAFDVGGEQIWSVDIVREPCPWPWWELPTPAPVQVAGGMDEGNPFFAVGCGDIQIRCFNGAGEERWRRRYNEGVPGRVCVGDIDGSGRDRIVVGGEVLSDTSTCRILDPDGNFLAQLSVEGWTSMLTALALGHVGDRRFIGCGANRGKNWHLFELERQSSSVDTAATWTRRWMKRLGGQVTGTRIIASGGGLVLAATSQGFLLCCNLQGDVLWHRLFARGIEQLMALGDETLICDNGGDFWTVNPAGDIGTSVHLPAPCSIVRADDKAVHFVCDREIWRL